MEEIIKEEEDEGEIGEFLARTCIGLIGSYVNTQKYYTRLTPSSLYLSWCLGSKNGGRRCINGRFSSQRDKNTSLTKPVEGELTKQAFP